MITKFDKIFVKTLLEYNKQMIDQNKIKNINLYISDSLKKMPDFMRNCVFLISISFNYLFIFIYLKRFEDLDIEKRLCIINAIKSRNIFLLNLLIRLYENLILNRYYEDE